MHAFRISREQRRHVVDDLLEACKPDGFEGVARARSARQINLSGFHGRGFAAFEQLIAAFGLALKCELTRDRMG